MQEKVEAKGGGYRYFRTGGYEYEHSPEQYKDEVQQINEDL